jgi:glycosyltransferase involved in cell wall biosynthesis
MPGVRVLYIERSGGLWRVARFLRQLFKITHLPTTIIYIEYFKMVSTVIRLFRPKNPLVLNIRTGSVSPIPFKRFFEDVRLIAESKLFKNINIISWGLSKKLGLEKRAWILPLGAEIISDSEKNFNDLNLLYVGSLNNRNIDKAAKGFAQFYKNNKDKCNMKFTIIGSGPGNELAKLKAFSKKTGLEDVINVLGFVPHDQLKPYFDTHNIGISYVPLTPYYDVQPVTKTFEYLMSGMPVLATSTSENKLVINQSNGVLTDDTPEGINMGLSKIYHRKTSYNSAVIRRNSLKYNWEDIVRTLERYIQTL